MRARSYVQRQGCSTKGAGAGRHCAGNHNTEDKQTDESRSCTGAVPARGSGTADLTNTADLTDAASISDAEEDRQLGPKSDWSIEIQISECGSPGAMTTEFELVRRLSATEMGEAMKRNVKTSAKVLFGCLVLVFSLHVAEDGWGAKKKVQLTPGNRWMYDHCRKRNQSRPGIRACCERMWSQCVEACEKKYEGNSTDVNLCYVRCSDAVDACKDNARTPSIEPAAPLSPQKVAPSTPQVPSKPTVGPAPSTKMAPSAPLAPQIPSKPSVPLAPSAPSKIIE